MNIYVSCLVRPPAAVNYLNYRIPSHIILMQQITYKY